jgi:ElaB/YqjD/DUF883 family membrane-anchored ribosome-binding protein
MQSARQHLRAARADARTLRSAARDAARHAGAAGNIEVQKLIEDVEELIENLGEAIHSPETERMRARVADTIVSTRRALTSGASQMRRQAGEAWDAGDSYVRAQPWQAVGAAALAGLVIGLLVFRRS